MHENPRFNVVREQRNFHGVSNDYYYVEKPSAVIVLVSVEDSILFLEVERVNQDGIKLELPGGRIENNESPVEAARRELFEETGIEANDLSSLAKTKPLPSVTTETVYAFHLSLKKLPSIFDESGNIHEGIKGWRLVNLRDIAGLCLTGSIGCSVDGFFSLLLEKSLERKL